MWGTYQFRRYHIDSHWHISAVELVSITQIRFHFWHTLRNYWHAILGITLKHHTMATWTEETHRSWQTRHTAIEHFSLNFTAPWIDKQKWLIYRILISRWITQTYLLFTCLSIWRYRWTFPLRVHIVDFNCHAPVRLPRPSVTPWPWQRQGTCQTRTADWLCCSFGSREPHYYGLRKQGR